MRTIECNVDRRVISFDSMSILQGGVGVDAIHVQFDSEWDGMAVTAYFAGSGTAKAVVLGTDGYATVPWETISGTGRLHVSFEGKGSGTRVTTSAKSAWLEITPCGDMSGGGSAAPTQDVLSQMQSRIAALESLIKGATFGDFA